MIAEDEESIIASLEFVMRKNGHQICVVRDGAEAIERLPEFQPHLLLLDIMLPRKSGIEVCQAIRRQPDLADIRILMLTAKGGRSEVARGAEAGANDYMSKPFSTRELVSRVNRLLEYVQPEMKGDRRS